MLLNKARQPTGASRVGAVIVSYFPDIVALTYAVDAISDQVSHIVIVDNGSSLDLSISLTKLAQTKQITLIKFQENMGIAAAQNAGIESIQKLGVEFVILFDQDSCPAPGMVDELLKAHDEHASLGVPIAALGPLTIDEKTRVPGKFVAISRGRVVSQNCPSGNARVFSDFLIASGCMMPLTAIRDIGEMNHSYFIDHVDTEWCVRARMKGWSLIGVCDAKLFHNLGDRAVRIWIGRWREVSVHSPLRNYYMVRNTLIMIRETAMPLSWRFAFLLRLLLFVMFLIVWLPSRTERVKMVTTGIWHGLSSRSGKYLGTR